MDKRSPFCLLNHILHGSTESPQWDNVLVAQRGDHFSPTTLDGLFPLSLFHSSQSPSCPLCLGKKISKPFVNCGGSKSRNSCSMVWLTWKEQVCVHIYVSKCIQNSGLLRFTIYFCVPRIVEENVCCVIKKKTKQKLLHLQGHWILLVKVQNTRWEKA